MTIINWRELVGMFRRIATFGAAAVLAASGTAVVAAMPASAGTVSVVYYCGIPPFGSWGPDTYQFTINAPATATRGQTVTLTASIASRAVTEHTPAGQTNRYFKIALHGASSGMVQAAMNNPELQPGDLWHIDGTAQATLGNAGDVTFHPDDWGVPGGGLICVPKDRPNVPAAARTHVQ